jgi:hypothetical protein
MIPTKADFVRRARECNADRIRFIGDGLDRLSLAPFQDFIDSPEIEGSTFLQGRILFQKRRPPRYEDIGGWKRVINFDFYEEQFLAHHKNVELGSEIFQIIALLPIRNFSVLLRKVCYDIVQGFPKSRDRDACVNAACHVGALVGYLSDDDLKTSIASYVNAYLRAYSMILEEFSAAPDEAEYAPAAVARIEKLLCESNGQGGAHVALHNVLGQLLSLSSRTKAAAHFAEALAADTHSLVAMMYMDMGLHTYFVVPERDSASRLNGIRSLARLNLSDPENPRSTLLFSVDPSFLRIYGPLIAFFAQQSPEIDFNIILVSNDDTKAILDDLQAYRIALSRLNSGAVPSNLRISICGIPDFILNLKTFFACARFLFAPDFLHVYDRVFIVDADMFYNEEPATFVQSLKGSVSLVRSKGTTRISPWRRTMAGNFMINNHTEGATAFLNDLIGYIVSGLSKKDSWMLDQNALTYALERNPQIVLEDLGTVRRPFSQPKYRSRWEHNFRVRADKGGSQRKALDAMSKTRYETLSSLDFTVILKHADRILEFGWERRNYPAVPLDQPIPWAYSLIRHRSWNFHIHCLDMLDPLLGAYDQTQARRYLESALRVGLDWARRHPRRAEGLSDMAWYDMAVGLRAYRLGYLYQAATRAGLLTGEDRKALWRSLEEHRTELADDATIAFHNNHGYYQIAGQLALGRRFADISPGMKALYDQGVERFGRMLDQQFSPEGVHREHSPDYHRMVLDTLQGIIRSGLIDDPALRARALRTEEALAWFITPVGDIVNFGDSDTRSVLRTPGAAARKWDSDLMRAVSSNRPTELTRPAGLQDFPQSGYAIIRQPDPAAPADPRRDSYLAQTGAFHSRTHKHADDLSFVWHDRGQPILIDAGRYGYLGKAEQGSDLWLDGYWYSDPMRVYMESTRAHNTLEFDGRNFPRKGVKPYGSALHQAAEFDGTFVIETRQRQFRSIRHERVLVFRPRQWLIVMDAFTDNLDQAHDVRQWFHMPPGAVVAPHGEGYRATLSDGTTLNIAPLLGGAAAMDVIEGQESPQHQGFWSGKEREALPAPAFGFLSQNQSKGSLATIFSFSEGLESDHAHSQTNVTGRRFRLLWKDQLGPKRLTLHRDDTLWVEHVGKEA